MAKNKVATKKKSPAQKYKELVKGTLDMIESTRRLALEFYWTLGDNAKKIGKPEYGKNTIELFSDDIGWNKADVYKCIQFRETWPTKVDLKRAADRQLTWTHIKALQDPDLSKDERMELEARVETDQLGANELKRIVKDMTADSKTPTVKPLTSGTVFNKITSSCEGLISLLGDFIEAKKVVKGLKGQALTEAQESLDETTTLLSQLVATIKEVSKK